MLRSAIALLLATLALPIGADTNAREVEEDCSLTSTFETPHKDWGAGRVGGPMHALVFCCTGPYDGTWEDAGTRVREIVELQQRFDVEADAVLFCGSGDGQWAFHGRDLGEARAERLLEKPYDLYCIAGFPMAKLPPKMQYQIIERVAHGAGLLCTGPGAPEYTTPKRQLTPTPAALIEGVPAVEGQAPADVVSAYTLGSGRGVWLNYGASALVPHAEYSPRQAAEYDHRMLLVGRAALWAAGREGDVSIVFVTGEPPAAGAPVEEASAPRAVLQNDSGERLALTVHPELRRADDGLRVSLPAETRTLDPGEAADVTVALPPLRAGDWFLDAVVTSPRGNEACGAAAYTVESPYGVESVTLDRTFVEVGETVHGTAVLRGTPPTGASLRVRFRDSYDRVLGQRDAALHADRTEVAFAYEADAFSTSWMRAEALVMIGGQEIELKEASFSVPKRRHGQHNFVMWDAPLGTLGPHAWRRLQEVGVNTCLIGSMGGERPQPAALRACDASLVPYSTRILDPKDANGFMQPVCWNDEPAVTEHVERIVTNQRQLREQGVFVYSLGDEGVTQGCCVHPACLAAYRRYLSEHYDSIADLNAAWGATYASFDEVNLLDPTDNMESASLHTCPPRWYDRQAFARWNLMQLSGRFVKAYRELDPQALTGFEGTGGFGDDYDAILGTNTFYGPYPGIGDDIVRSVAPRSTVRSNWMGYSKTGDALSDAAWRMVMKGMDSVWFWMWSGIGDWRGYLRPTLDFWPATEDLAEEMRPVRQGLGDLLLHSEVAHSGIAVFYSLPSALACEVSNTGGFVEARADHEAWLRLTYELGLDVRYVTSAMLADGALDAGEFRMLILPMTQALSATEADAIRRFAEAGGTVVADVRPGVYDEHLRAVRPGRLDNLFGIARTPRDGPAEASPLVLRTDMGGRSVSAQMPAVRPDAEVAVAGAQALGVIGDAPAVLVRALGRGRAVLLNFEPSLATPENVTASREVLRWLYQVGGAEPPIVARSPDGGPLAMTETRVWRNGNALVFGLWRRMENAWFGPKTGTTAGPPVPAAVDLPEPMYVYDLRNERALGRVSRIETELHWGRASFFLALPYELKAPRIAASPRAPAPGEAVTVRVRMDRPRDARETLALWVEVTDPEGNTPLWGRQVALLSGDVCEVRFPTAYNAAKGRWRARVTELFSGRSAEAAWNVR